MAVGYVRNAAEKNRLSELALKARQELAGKRRLLAEEKQRAIYLADEVEQLTNREKLLTDELESAAEHLAKVMAAVSLQKKIEMYRADLAELMDKLEQQQAIVEEITASCWRWKSASWRRQKSTASRPSWPTTSRRSISSRPAPSSTARRCRRWRLPASSASCRG